MPKYVNSFVPRWHNTTYAAISEANPALSARGKIVFITGGGRGIGRAISAAFATAQAEGIFLLGRNGADLAEAAHLTTEIARKVSPTSTTAVRFAIGDITDSHSVSAAIQLALSSFGRIDVLVQNAGYLDAHHTVVDSDLQDYWRTFEVNVKGGLNVIQAFLKTNPETGSTLINIGSGVGHIPYIPGYSAYGGSKLALAKIVEYVQHENPSLRVFNINPGAIATEMQAKAGDVAAPDDIELPGSFCVWLAASEKADKLKGRFLWSNWDVDDLDRRAEEIREKNLLVHGLVGL